MPFYQIKKIIMNLKNFSNYFVVIPLIFFLNLKAEEEEIYLKSISDQIQVITKF